MVFKNPLRHVPLLEGSCESNPFSWECPPPPAIGFPNGHTMANNAVNSLHWREQVPASNVIFLWNTTLAATINKSLSDTAKLKWS